MSKTVKILPKYKIPVINKKGNSRAKTHDQYVAEVLNVNPNIEVIGQYVNSTTKILHRCKIHDYEWMVLPPNILKGKGCHECMKDKNRKKFLKSNEQYIQELAIVNPNLELLEQYIGSETPVLHKCKKHNVEWKIAPSNALHGQGCSKCKIDKIINYNFKSHEQYIAELYEANPHIEALEKYIGTKTPIKHHCIIHDIYFTVAPCNILKSFGCEKCTSEHKKAVISKSNDEFQKCLSENNPHIIPLTKYVDCKTKMKFQCLIHYAIWETYPNNILKSAGCKQCQSDKFSKLSCLTHNEYVLRLKDINPTVIAIGKYINIKTPITHKCLIHNIEWETTPGSALQGCGCNICRSEKISNNLQKKHEQYVNELYNVNPSLIAIENYAGANKPILHRCLNDGYEWKISPSNVLFGYGCPMCHETKGERRIRLWLEKNNITYIFQKKFDDCKDKNMLPFDFYLPNHNKIIEYDGQQHFEANDHFGGEDGFQTTKRHDNIKNDYCKSCGIPLLRIPYFNFKNIEEELDNFVFN